MKELDLYEGVPDPSILPIFDCWVDADGNPWSSMMRVPAPRSGSKGAVPTLPVAGNEVP